MSKLIMNASHAFHGGRWLRGRAAIFLMVSSLALGISTEALGDEVTNDFYQNLFGEDLGLENDQLFLRIETDRNILLAETVVAMKQEGRIYLDFIETVRSMGFAINWEGSVIAGWVRTESNLFSLDPTLPELKLKGEEAAIDLDVVQIQDGTVFVALEPMAGWLGLEYEFDEAGQFIILKGNPVPTEDAILRQRIRDRIQIGETNVDPEYWKKADHDLLSWPTINMVSNSNWSNSNTYIGTTLQAIAEQDVLKTRLKLTANATRGRGLTDLRVESRRTELDTSLPYTEFSLGDISGFKTINATSSNRGLGFKVTNKPLSTSNILGEENITGDVPVGWEVEIYRDDILIDFQVAGDDGLYSFDAVPLTRGVNDIKIIQYGPQGQTRIIEERILADSNNPQKGEVRYSVSALSDDKTLLGVKERENAQSNSNYVENKGLYRFTSDVSYGVSNKLAITGGVSQTPEVEGDLRFINFGLRSSIQGNPISLDMTQGLSLAEGQAFRFFSRSPFFGANLNLTHNEYFGFVGEQNRVNGDYGSPLYRRTSLFSLSLPSIKFAVREKPWNLQNTASFNRKEKENGFIGWDVSPTTTLSTPLGSLTNRFDIDFEKERGENNKVKAFGSLTGTHTYDQYRFWTALDYQIRPLSLFRKVSLDVDYRYDEELSFQSKIGRRLEGDLSSSLRLGVRGRFDFGEAGLSLTGDSRRSRSANLTMSMGLQKNPATGDFQLRQTRQLRGGSIVSRVFIDHNINGVFDTGDEPLKDILVKSNSSQKYSNDMGLVSISALPLYKPIEVHLDERSVKDPFLAGGNDRVTVALKDGSILPIDFPLAPSGEIEGKVEIAGRYEDGSVFFKPLSNAVIEVVSEKRGVVVTSISTYDGTYIATNIPIGKYYLRIADEYLKRISAKNASTKAETYTHLAQQGDWITDVNLTLAYENEALNVPRSRNESQENEGADSNILFEKTSPTIPKNKDPLSGIPDELKTWFE